MLNATHARDISVQPTSVGDFCVFEQKLFLLIDTEEVNKPSIYEIFHIPGASTPNDSPVWQGTCICIGSSFVSKIIASLLS